MKSARLWKKGRYVAMYNSVFGASRKDFLRAAKILTLSGKDRLLDLGCGNGDFLKLASRRAGECVGVDCSPEQLEMARKNLRRRKNVKLVESDFMDFVPEGKPFTRGFSRKALHHLKDGEKAVFFRRMGKYFAKNALFLLEDGIFDFERKDLKKNWKGLMLECAEYYGEGWGKKKKEVVYCFTREYPTGLKAWARAFRAGGFRIVKVEKKNSFYGSILAKKKTGREV